MEARDWSFDNFVISWLLPKKCISRGLPSGSAWSNHPSAIRFRILESGLGVKLLHRTTRRSWLTRAGERLPKEARRSWPTSRRPRPHYEVAEDEGLTLKLGLAEHAAGEAFTRLLFELLGTGSPGLRSTCGRSRQRKRAAWFPMAPSK